MASASMSAVIALATSMDFSTSTGTASSARLPLFTRVLWQPMQYCFKNAWLLDGAGATVVRRAEVKEAAAANNPG